MLQFAIKTWSCSACGYKQDCEPTQENADLHFNADKHFPVVDLTEGECPNCANNGVRGKILKKENNTDKKCTMAVLDSQADIEAEKQRLLRKPKEKIRLGFTTRPETDAERTSRIDKDLKKLDHLSPAAKQSVKTSLSALPVLSVTEEISREETDEERNIRVEKIVGRLRVATTAEIAELRAKYEDA